jgi:hypothetical protein
MYTAQYLSSPIVRNTVALTEIVTCVPEGSILHLLDSLRHNCHETELYMSLTIYNALLNTNAIKKGTGLRIRRSVM